VPLDEVVPGSAAALGPWIESIFPQDATDGCARDVVDTELLEFTEDVQ
jgi:hypothetical protein